MRVSPGVCTYRAAGGVVMAALAGHLEGNIVGGVALDLEGASREVVEVLVEELESTQLAVGRSRLSVGRSTREMPL